MKCQRCRSDTSVEKHTIDGFSGYLCASCRKEWFRVSNSGPLLGQSS